MAEKHPIPSSHRFQDLTGQVFGRQTVIAYAGTDRKRNRIWLVRCSCDGNERTVAGDKLVGGRTQSCGCLKLELLAQRATHGAKRGGKTAPGYHVWTGMRQRCNNPNDAEWPRYGGRGIKVCKAWEASFEAFIADVGPRPTAKHTLERIDNDRGYEPGNCRWATPEDQANNTRRNRNMTYDGRTQSCSRWARERGMSAFVLIARLNYGWTDEEALTTPVKKMSLDPAVKKQRQQARWAVNNAVRAGTLASLATQACVRCGKQAEQYHHHLGYDKANWLKVVPACKQCHQKIPEGE